MFILNATSPENLTTDDLTCYAKVEDSVLSELNVYSKWYNGTSLIFNDVASVQNDTLTLI